MILRVINTIFRNMKVTAIHQPHWARLIHKILIKVCKCANWYHTYSIIICTKSYVNIIRLPHLSNTALIFDVENWKCIYKLKNNLVEWLYYYYLYRLSFIPFYVIDYIDWHKFHWEYKLFMTHDKGS